MSLQLLRSALQSRSFEVTDLQASAQQLRITGRVPEDATTTDNWFFALRQLIITMGRTPWKADLSKNYIVRPSDGKLLFCWRLIFQSPDDIGQHYKEIAGTITAAPKTNRVELTSYPLSGNRSQNADRVGPVGKVRTLADQRRK